MSDDDDVNPLTVIGWVIQTAIWIYLLIVVHNAAIDLHSIAESLKRMAG